MTVFPGVPENFPPGHFFAFSGISGISGISTPQKWAFLQNPLCAAGYPPGNSGDFRGFFRHFRDKKIVQNCPKSPKKHPEKHSEIFRGFSRNPGCKRLVKKGSKIPPGSPEFPEFAQICTNFFPEFSGGIFGDF